MEQLSVALGTLGVPPDAENHDVLESGSYLGSCGSLCTSDCAVAERGPLPDAVANFLVGDELFCPGIRQPMFDHALESQFPEDLVV